MADYLARFYAPYPGCDFSPLASSHYRLEECAACGCVFQNPAPSSAFLNRFYADGLYGAGAQPYVLPTAEHIEHMVRELTMAVRFLRDQGITTPTVLDFGTGEGRWARLAAACGVAAHACDVSTHAFAKLTGHGVTCHLTDQLPDEHFDFINTEQVFEHLPEPAATIRSCAAALKPGGTLKIGVPHDPELLGKLRAPDWTAPKHSPASLNAVAPIEHLNHFTPRSLDCLARNAGLERLEVTGWDLIQPAYEPPPTLRQRITRGLRERLHETYRPYHSLTQTAFYRKPAP